MKIRLMVLSTLAGLIAAWGAGSAAASDRAPAEGSATAFSFAGKLSQPNGTYDFQFQLFDASSGGNAQTGQVIASSVAVKAKAYSTVVDFGSNPFTGKALYMQVGWRVDGGGSFTQLSNRPEIIAGAYALGLKLPYTAYVTTGGTGLTIENNGTGEGITGFGGTAGVLGIDPTVSGAGVHGDNTAGGVGVYGTSDGTAVWGVSTGGVGVAGQATSGAGVSGQSATFYGVQGVTQNGYAGVYGNATGANNGVYGHANNTASGVYGTNDGTGPGVAGSSQNGYGVSGTGYGTAYAGIYGTSPQNGVYGITGAAAASGVYGQNTGSGVGVAGYSPNGVGGSFTGTTALQLGGEIQVLGAGVDTATPVFVHFATNANICGASKNWTLLDNPYLNGRPDAIVFVSPLNTTPMDVLYFSGPVGGCPANRWYVEKYNVTQWNVGETFSVLVVDP